MNGYDVSEQEQASETGSRASKEPGDPLWCWQTISALQSMWKSLNLDADRYIQTWGEAEEYKVWEKVPYNNPFGSKEEMLKQLEIGDDKATQKRMEIQAIVSRARRLLKHGANQRGTTSEYILARIAKDRPDILERYESGEFKNAAAAARAAGIELAKRKRTVILGDNVERVADTILGHYTEEQLARMIQRLSNRDSNRGTNEST